MIPDHPFHDYRDRRVLVMGLGSFGGGIGAVQFLGARGARITITDLRSPDQLSESLEQLRGTPIDELVLGQHRESDFRETELVVVNPAVKRSCPFVNAARQAGVPITSEMNLFWKWNPAPVVAVTGSNGKSTTTAMTHDIIDEFARQTPGRRAWLGGNIGASLLPQVDQIGSNDIVVLELSSFQLADLDRMQVSPHVAVVTNFAPNHLDWHTDLADYRRAKQTILRWQTAGDIAILNDDDSDVREWNVNGHRLGFGLTHREHPGAYWRHDHAVIRIHGIEQRIPLKEWLQLPGEHNLANALAATAAGISLAVSDHDVRQALTRFHGLPHRLQLVREVNGRKFYNDSLATTPESTEVALKAFESPIVLLAGGYDKQIDLDSMAHAIARRVKAVALMGQTASQLSRSITSIAGNTCRASPPQTTFAAAFDWAVAQSAPGDVIVLSPGCASYDWFQNFADRGAQFVNLVRDYANQSRNLA